jgi:transmembrane sensor
METNEQILDEACEWLVTLRHDPDAAAQDRFMAWLRRSPEHVRAYLGRTSSAHVPEEMFLN